MAEYLPLFLGVTFIGFVWALPVLIPPLRRWLRGRDIRRLTAVLLFSGTLLFLMLLALAYLSAASYTLLSLCYPSPHIENCNDEKAVQLGFASGDELRKAISMEMFRRFRTVTPFPQECYADDPALCQFIASSPPGDMDSLGLINLVIACLWAVFVTGFWVWFWTRPRTPQST